MAGKLKKQEGTETLTFEVFELDLSQSERQALADDPRGFLDNLLKEEGMTVNGLLVEADEKFKGPEGLGATGTGPSLPPTVWHCTAPPDKASRWITIVPGVAETDE